MKQTFVLVAAILCAATLSAAPQYVEFKPLSEVVKTPVAKVSGKAQVLPLITWGGDIATIVANGDKASTAPGSLFAERGLNYRLVREDSFPRQVAQYMSGKTPYLRGTMGMLTSAVDVLGRDERTRPVVFYQMTWSAGGDALVVKPGIRKAADLRGKTIALQAYGPHVDYLIRVLKDAGLTIGDVRLRWLPDLTGSDNSPAAALYESDIDAAFVIVPDALALTSGGKVGTGAEASVKGARVLMSTKTANRVIADVYAVRSDYYKANRDEIDKLTAALIAAEKALKTRVDARSQSPDSYRRGFRAAAELLLDSPDAMTDAEGLYADCEFVGVAGNQRFFNDANYPRNFERVAADIRQGFTDLKLISGKQSLVAAEFNAKQLGAVAQATPQARFNRDEVSALVTRKQQQGALDDSELFSFEVFFAPNQTDFPTNLYQDDFKRVVDLASTYGGAIITVEGHSDPMGYLRAKKKGEPSLVLGRIKQSAKNLSVSRAQSVQSAIVGYAQQNGVALDESQFEPIGHGITQPNTGICGSDPCPPQTEKDWRSNMRVVFRIIQVEAEDDVFRPL